MRKDVLWARVWRCSGCCACGLESVEFEWQVMADADPTQGVVLPLASCRCETRLRSRAHRAHSQTACICTFITHPPSRNTKHQAHPSGGSGACGGLGEGGEGGRKGDGAPAQHPPQSKQLQLLNPEEQQSGQSPSQPNAQVQLPSLPAQVCALTAGTKRRNHAMATGRDSTRLARPPRHNPGSRAMMGSASAGHHGVGGGNGCGMGDGLS